MALLMSDEEIAREYRTAKEPDKQVQVLADLNMTSKRAIVAALARKGIRAKPVYTRIDDEKARALYDQRRSDAHIARELECSVQAVKSWRKRNGLPAVSKTPLEPEKEEAGKEEPLPAADKPSGTDPGERMLHIIQDALFLLPPRPSLRVRSAIEQLASALALDYVDSQMGREEDET